MFLFFLMLAFLALSGNGGQGAEKCASSTRLSQHKCNSDCKECEYRHESHELEEKCSMWSVSYLATGNRGEVQ